MAYPREFGVEVEEPKKVEETKSSEGEENKAETPKAEGN